MRIDIPNANKTSVVEKLFSYREFADVIFLVGNSEPKMFRAHRCILMAVSEKFKTLILSHDPLKPIAFPEIEPDVFQQLLKVIYLNCFDIDSVGIAKDCLKIFQEFGLISAAKAHDDFFSNPNNINNDTAILMYEVNLLSNTNPTVVERCIKRIATNTREVLKSRSFYHASLDTILAIFERSTLNIRSEIVLLDALCEYAKKKNALPGHNSGGDDARFAVWVKPALAKIRFLTLTPKEFLESKSVRTLLTNDQGFSIIANINVPQNPLYKMPDGLSSCKTNRSMYHQVVERCRHILKDWIEQGKSVGKGQNVCKFIEDLVNGKIVPEEFFQNLKSELNLVPSLWVADFFIQNHSILRYSLVHKHLVIEGINAPCVLAS